MNQTPPFDIEDLTEEFLYYLTKIHAEWVHKETHGRNGNDSNWYEGKRVATVTVIERYLQQCKEKSKCLKVPDCFCSYLKEITVQDLKEYKAYFSWVKKGKQKDNPHHIKQAEYLNACNNLMAFCTSLPLRKNKCGYNELLSIIDRRVGADRRGNGSGKIKKSTERRKVNRRINDHRGSVATILSD